jgi:hypothetical protein
MPWFSVPTGRPAVVQANIASPDTTFNADTIRFCSSLGMNIIPEPSPQDSVLYLSIQGRTHEQEQVIEAYMPYVDSTGTQQEKVIGQCKVITYNSTAHNLVVVPLNNATVPTGAVLEDRLNDILGHGSFRLYHTFSDKNDYPVALGTTDNLMDYNNGSNLHKYQWDYIKDPRNMMFAWAQSEEEGAAIIEFPTCTKMEIERFRAAYIHGNSVSFTKDIGLGYSADDIKLLDGKEYEVIGISVSEDVDFWPHTVNPTVEIRIT